MLHVAHSAMQCIDTVAAVFSVIALVCALLLFYYQAKLKKCSKNVNTLKRSLAKRIDAKVEING
jgi:hypothetical protein